MLRVGLRHIPMLRLSSQNRRSHGSHGSHCHYGFSLLAVRTMLTNLHSMGPPMRPMRMGRRTARPMRLALPTTAQHSDHCDDKSDRCAALATGPTTASNKFEHCAPLLLLRLFTPRRSPRYISKRHLKGAAEIIET